MTRDEILDKLRKKLEDMERLNAQEPKTYLPVPITTDELRFILSEIKVLSEERDYWQRLAGY